MLYQKGLLQYNRNRFNLKLKSNRKDEFLIKEITDILSEKTGTLDSAILVLNDIKNMLSRISVFGHSEDKKFSNVDATTNLIADKIPDDIRIYLGMQSHRCDEVALKMIIALLRKNLLTVDRAERVLTDAIQVLPLMARLV